MRRGYLTPFDRPRGAQARSVASSVGFLLLDSAHKPFYSNPEAIRILTFSVKPGDSRPLEALLAERVRFVFRKHRPLHSDSLFEFVSGRRRYLCRVINLPSPPGSPPELFAALLLERKAAQCGASQAAKQYNLTSRELQAVELLMDGLRSKEIALRMQISPNTVKTFLRLVMLKMGVSTRSGIVRKVFEQGSRLTA